MVKIINDDSKIPSKKVVLDFYADWCGPCKRIAPKFKELSEKYTNITFLKVNVDESEELTRKYEVQAMPTFVFLNDREMVGKFEGASLDKLVENLENLNKL